MLSGSITQGNTVVLVNYNNFGLFLSAAQDGAAKLNTALLAGSGQMIVFAHSLGAVAARYWIANYGPTSSISPANLSFVLIGDSVNPFGGLLETQTNWFPGTQIPLSNQYTVTDFIMQYDGWADWPAGWLTNLDAELNALDGQNSVHYWGYRNVTLANAVASFVVGNVTYMWALTVPVPLTGSSTLDANTEAQDKIDRPIIEGAYTNRPVALPSPWANSNAGTVIGLLTVSPVFSAHLASQVHASKTITPTFSATLKRSMTASKTVTPTFSAQLKSLVHAAQTITPTFAATLKRNFTATQTITPTFHATINVLTGLVGSQTITPTFHAVLAANLHAALTVTPTFSATIKRSFTATQTVTPTFAATLKRSFTAAKTITPTFSAHLAANVHANQTVTPTFSAHIAANVHAALTVTPTFVATLTLIKSVPRPEYINTTITRATTH
jgi:hypothetical protein